MNRWTISLLVIMVALAGFFFTRQRPETLEQTPPREISSPLPALTPPKLEILPNQSGALKSKTWATFEEYLKFAHAHDLVGLRGLSYQISDTCNNAEKEAECFALMDSVYALASPFSLNDFKHILSDEKQIILHTDGPNVVILYFVREDANSTKVLGMRFCLEDDTSPKKCVEPDAIKQDENSNGWWDNVESLFYKN